MVDLKSLGTGSLGYIGCPLRKFEGRIARASQEDGQQGRPDRLKLDVVELEVFQSVVEYPYPTIVIDLSMPNEKAIERASGIPPRSLLGILLGSMDEVFPGGISFDKLIADKTRVGFEVKVQKRPGRTQDEETGKWEETGEMIEFQEFRITSAQVSGESKAIGDEVNPVDVLVGLIPYEGATASEIAELYMGSEISGKLDDGIFKQTLLPELVSRGVLTLGEDNKYSKV